MRISRLMKACVCWEIFTSLLKSCSSLWNTPAMVERRQDETAPFNKLFWRVCAPPRVKMMIVAQIAHGDIECF